MRQRFVSLILILGLKTLSFISPAFFTRPQHGVSNRIKRHYEGAKNFPEVYHIPDHLSITQAKSPGDLPNPSIQNPYIRNNIKPLFSGYFQYVSNLFILVFHIFLTFFGTNYSENIVVWT